MGHNNRKVVRQNWRKLAGTWIAVLALASFSFATQRHATPSGAGAHTGSDLANAWSFTESMGAKAGDTVNYHAGTYPYIIAPSDSGTASQPIVFRAYDTDFVLFTGETDTHPQVVVIWQSYIEVHGINIVTAENPAGNSSYIVSLEGNHLKLKKCWIDYPGDVVNAYNTLGYRTRGIVAAGQYIVVDSNYVRGMNEGIASAGGSPRYHQIINNTIHAAVWNHLLGLGTDDGTSNLLGVLIAGNEADTSYGEDCLQFQQAGGEYSFLKNSGYIVRNNRFANAGENLIDLKGCGYVVIENNVLHTSNGDDDGLWGAGWGTGSAIERGNPDLIRDFYTVIRNNVLYDGAHGIRMSEGGQVLNNIVVNNRRYLTTSDYEGSINLEAIRMEGNLYVPRTVVNNIFAQQNGNYHHVWLMDGQTIPTYVDHNIYYDSAGTPVFNHRVSGSQVDVTGLANWQTALDASAYSFVSGKEDHSLSSDPKFVDFPFVAKGYDPAWDWSLDPTSPAIDAGTCWTFTSGTGTGLDHVVVANPYVFTDGYGIVPGDSIMVEGNAATQIWDIDYDGGILYTLNDQTYGDGDSVFFWVNGQRMDDIGAVAVLGAGGDPEDPEITAPPTPTNVQPISGSSVDPPVTIRWRQSAGATQYWLCVSGDNWGTLVINANTLTDTFYTTNLLPRGVTYVWNVAAGNTVGWSAFSTDWTFYLNPPSGDDDTTFTLDWKYKTHPLYISTETYIEMTNVIGRDIVVLTSNPDANPVYWPEDIRWITSEPPTVLPEYAMFMFVRNADTVHGAYMNTASSGGTTWGSIVGSLNNQTDLIARLMQYARLDRDLRLYGDQQFRKITLVETSGPDSVIIYDDNGVLSFWDATTGWKTLAELAAGGGGGADGQNADSIQGRPVSGLRPATGKSIVTYDPDSLGYRHLATLGLDSAGVGNGEGKKLTIIGGNIVARNDSVITDHGLLGGLADDDHTQYALDTDIIQYDSTMVVMPILDSTWIAAYGTTRHIPVLKIHKALTVDSMFVAVIGAAATDTVQVDIRWGNDYGTANGGTALQSSPTDCPASSTGTLIGSFTNATITDNCWLWMRLTKKVGTPKNVSVTLKGRWL